MMHVHFSCYVLFIDVHTWVDLIILDMLDFDVILGITYLSLYHAILKFNVKIVTLEMPGMDNLD